MMIKPLFPPRVRFNWGFHDASFEMAQGRARTLSANQDRFYVAGHVAGKLDFETTGQRSPLSDAAWEKFLTSQVAIGKLCLVSNAAVSPLVDGRTYMFSDYHIATLQRHDEMWLLVAETGMALIGPTTVVQMGDAIVELEKNLLCEIVRFEVKREQSRRTYHFRHAETARRFQVQHSPDEVAANPKFDLFELCANAGELHCIGKGFTTLSRCADEIIDQLLNKEGMLVFDR